MNEKLVQLLKIKIKENGIKYSFIAKETGIEYQRLMRIFNQRAVITGSELLKISLVLKLDQSELTSIACNSEKTA